MNTSKAAAGFGVAGRLFRSALSLLLVVAAGGFAAAALVRYSPGFDVDENSWNAKISPSTLAAMHANRERQNSLPQFYAHYLMAALHGDLGQSDSLRVPVTELLRDRAPVSARLVASGTAGGLSFGAALAWLAVWPRRPAARWFASGTSGFLLAIPPAVLGLAFFFSAAPLSFAVALALTPRVFGTLRALFDELYGSAALLAARARGVGPFTLGTRYVLGAAAPQLIALIGVAFVMAFGSIIPIEALCDVPGIGQLAWKAALARDLPLLSGLALIVTFMSAFVQSMGDLLTGEGW
jgi:peptide/nickel transport system permease protein